MQEYTIIFQEGFVKGLRPTTRAPKNAQALVLSEGAVPEDGLLRSLDEITAFGTDMGAAWPFPQVFQLKSFIMVALQDSLFSWSPAVGFELLIGALPIGSTWTVADYWPYIVATNGAVMVTRDPNSATWSIYTGTDIPACRCLTDVNGQLFIGGLEASGYE